MKSVMTHQFSRVPSVKIPRSSFDRSHGRKTTFDAGYLVPILVDEALPGDTFNLKMTSFCRLATPIAPVMDNMYLSTFYFAIPMRLIWSNWEKFNGQQTNPGDSTDFLIPTMTSTAGTGYAVESLHDYFGIPTGIPGLVHNSVWHRAYNLVFNEWFRDQNLQNSVVVDTDDGPDVPTDYVLLRRCKRHDYFTSALLWPQKGDAVDLPLGSTAPIIGNNTDTQVFNESDATLRTLRLQTSTGQVVVPTPPSATADLRFGTAVGNVGLIADLSAATAATINQLRQAFQIQRLLEKDARGGTRYTEVIRAHFGVISPDARLQRPEYLGGARTPVNVTQVPQTSSTDATTPQGNLAAYGTAMIRDNGFSKSFTEHCLILGIACVDADLTYQQGLNRMFSRQTRYDFYWPSLSMIGEQTILNKEIYALGSGNPTQDAAVFGYQERYAEYRYKPSEITGKFRSTAAGSLDFWHLSEEFLALPTLGTTFIQSNPPIDRVIAVPSEPHFIGDFYFSMRCARPMPLFGVPGLIDHF